MAILEIISKIAIALLGIGCFFLPVCTDLGIGMLIFCSLLLLILNRQFRAVFCEFHKQFPFWKPACLILIISLLGLIYTKCPFKLSLMAAKKYLSFPILPICLLPYFYFIPTNTRYLLKCFLTGAIVFFLYALVSGNDRYHVNPIGVSVLFSFASFVCLVKLSAYTNRRTTFYTICLFTLFVYFLFFINEERTGFVTFLLINAPYILTKLRARYLFVGFIIITFLGISFIQKKSPVINRFSDRMQVTDRMQVKDLETAIALVNKIAEKVVHKIASLCPQRYQMIERSICLIQEHPWIGHGTNGYLQGLIDHQWTFCGMKSPDYDGITRPHPHNDWLFFTVQWGLIGLIALIYWFGYALYFSAQCPKSMYKTMFICLNLTYMLASCFDVFLSSHYRITYLFLFCALAAKAACKGKTQNSCKLSIKNHR